MMPLCFHYGYLSSFISKVNDNFWRRHRGKLSRRNPFSEVKKKIP